MQHYEVEQELDKAIYHISNRELLRKVVRKIHMEKYFFKGG